MIIPDSHYNYYEKGNGTNQKDIYARIKICEKCYEIYCYLIEKGALLETMRANTLSTFQIENIKNEEKDYPPLKESSSTKNGKMMRALRYTLGLSNHLKIKNETEANVTQSPCFANRKRSLINSMTETKEIKSLFEKRSEILENHFGIGKERKERYNK